MRRFLTFLFAIAFFAFVATSAHAGALSTLVVDGMTINQLEDNDFERLVGDGDAIVEVGEFLVGMFEIQSLDAPIGGPKEANYDSTTATFTGVFVLKVAASTGPGGVTMFSFTSATAAEWAAVGAPAAAIPAAAGTLAVIFDDPASAPAEHIDATTGALTTSLATATNGTKLWEVGFRGDAGEFWSATTTDAGGAANDITAIDTLAFFANTNVTLATPAVGGIVLLKHNHIGFAAGPAEVQIVGSLALGQNPAGSDFDIATDSDIFILATPEPASIALFAIGMLAAGGYGLRRRKKLAA